MINAQRLARSNKKFSIEGSRVLLRPITSALINEAYVGWLNDPCVNRYMAFAREGVMQTEIMIYDYINSIRSNANREVFSILLKKSKIHVGNIAISSSQDGIVTTGFLVGDPKVRGQGLGAEAVRIFVEYVFRADIAHTVHAAVHSENIKSWKMLDALGFQKTHTVHVKNLDHEKQGHLDFKYDLTRQRWDEVKGEFYFVLKKIDDSSV
jgi:[ribosomal protein S5]-alanine N-acetyltransferase